MRTTGWDVKWVKMRVAMVETEPLTLRIAFDIELSSVVPTETLSISQVLNIVGVGTNIESLGNC